MNLDKVKFFDPKQVRGIGEKHKAKFIKRVEVKGLDYKGKKFKKYSPGYTKQIESNFTRQDGSRLKAYAGLPIAGKSTDPKFRLRGLTMGNLSVKDVTKEGYSLRFTGEAASIVLGNKERGRNIVDDFPKDEWDFILNSFGKSVDKEIKKIPRVTVIRV